MEQTNPPTCRHRRRPLPNPGLLHLQTRPLGHLRTKLPRCLSWPPCPHCLPQMAAPAVRVVPTAGHPQGLWPSCWTKAPSWTALPPLLQCLRHQERATPLLSGRHLRVCWIPIAEKALPHRSDACHFSRGPHALCGARLVRLFARGQRLTSRSMLGPATRPKDFSANWLATQRCLPPLHFGVQRGFACQAACSEPWSSL